MSTPCSNPVPYATNADFVARFDDRPTRQLLVDDGTMPPTTDLTDPTTKAYANLQTLLADASGEFELAVLQGGRYKFTDLVNLNGNSLAVMKRLVCSIVLRMVWERRQDGGQPHPAAMMASQMLDLIAQGERIFAIQEAADAGIMGAETEQPGLRPNDMVRRASGFFAPSDWGNRPCDR